LRKHSSLDIQEAAKLLACGTGCDEVAQLTGIPKWTVRTWQSALRHPDSPYQQEHCGNVIEEALTAKVELPIKGGWNRQPRGMRRIFPKFGTTVGSKVESNTEEIKKNVTVDLDQFVRGLSMVVDEYKRLKQDKESFQRDSEQLKKEREEFRREKEAYQLRVERLTSQIGKLHEDIDTLVHKD
jgi:FtsZ-binding cell division protein ZapB